MTTRKPIFEPGWYVALNLAPEANDGLRVVVGELQAVDEHGVRITLIDWLVGMPTGTDLYAPWRSILSARIATHEHNFEMFLKEASRWQESMFLHHETPTVPSGVSA